MTIAQIQISVPQPDYGALGYQSPVSESGLLIAGLAVTVMVLGLGLVFLIRTLLRRGALVPVAFQKVVLLVTMPKEAAQANDEKETLEVIRNQISQAENWFSTLGGLKAQRGLAAWLRGRTDHFALEIVVTGGLVSFYVVVPRYLEQHAEQQILAQYPEAHVIQTEDYNIFSPSGAIAGASLTLRRDYIMPIKTYKRLEVDPLNAVANSLSNMGKEDGAVIQIIARSAKKRWHRRGAKVARLLQRGKTIREALAIARPFSLVNLVAVVSSKTPRERIEAENNRRPMQPSPMEQELIKGIEEKPARAGLDCNLRILTAAADKLTAERYLKNITDAFSQFNFYQYGNSFRVTRPGLTRLATDSIYRNFSRRQTLLLNAEELASIFHLPTPFLETPNIRWLLARRLAPPPHLPQTGLLLGENLYRGVKTKVYLAPDDRRRHLYTIGMTGTGKSVLLANLAIQDIRGGRGVCVIDPHGSLVESVLAAVPRERIDDVIYFNPSDTGRPIGLNMLDAATPEQQDFAIQEMIAIFYKLVTDPSMIGPMFEHNMRNAMLTLMADREQPGTIAEIPRIFTDRDFQRYKVGKVLDPMVRSFWEQEMAKTSDFHKSEMLGYLISKVGRFVENAMMRNIIGQPKSGFNFRQVMDERKILLVNLAKGTTGEVNSNLLGLIIVAKLQMAALSRTNRPEEQRADFYLYLDEFQNFITDSIATILAEARKYRLNLTLAHQYLGQLAEGGGVENKKYDEKIKAAIFGNVGTMVSFRIGPSDAETITKQLAPTVNEYDLMNIEKYHAYLRLLVDNQPTKTFNIRTLPPITGDPKVAAEIKELSRWKYGVDREKVTADILARSRLDRGLPSPTLPPMERTT